MGNFFYGWWRKTGCVLLVTAAGIFGAWSRSRVSAYLILWPGQRAGRRPQTREAA